MVFGLTDCCVIGRKKNPLENNIFFTTDHVFIFLIMILSAQSSHTRFWLLQRGKVSITVLHKVITDSSAEVTEAGAWLSFQLRVQSVNWNRKSGFLYSNKLFTTTPEAADRKYRDCETELCDYLPLFPTIMFLI